MAAALAGLVLKQLSSLAADQAILLWGLESEIPKLANTVSSIQAVLLDAEQQSGHNHQVQLWLRRLEQVLYDAEDVLDDFSTEVLRRKQMDGNSVVNEVCLFFSPSNQVAYGLEIANRIKAVRSKLDEIDQDRSRFDFQKRPVDLVADDDHNKAWRQTHSSVPDVVIGREDDKQKLIDMLLLLSGDREKVAVVPIIGIGGLGKTTLAQLVFNDEVIKSHFTCRVWVCVSENFDPRLLVRKVLESITKKKVEDLELDTLKALLGEEIKNKRLLLVLDDVWNENREKWGCFQSLIAGHATEGSRIIVTSRLRMVGEMTATRTIVPHELNGLSESESWSLFEKMAFKGGVATSRPIYEEIGKEVVRKCCGVPLAVRTMGGLLSFKETESEWAAIREQQLLSLNNGGQQESNILAATLRLSYDNLPSHLKRCFAYCSLFPKDHIINVKQLVQLWMAQGYIITTKPSQSPRLEDVGVEHFKNLLWRSFFQEVTKDACGNMKSCKMHDLMHDLAVTVAGEEIVYLNASNFEDSRLSSDVNPERIRHLSIDFKERSAKRVWEIPTLLAKTTRLRTFLMLNVFCDAEIRGCEKIFSKMTRLRVLSLKEAKMEIVLSIIHNLKLLRYLDLYCNKMETLPNGITRMVNLQVLNLHKCENLRLLATDIGKLSNLLYLGLEGCMRLTCIPVGIGNLSFLRELSLFIVADATADGSSKAAAGLSELNSLNNLSGTLTIQGLERVKDKSEAEAANLKAKSQLRGLKLRWRWPLFVAASYMAARCDHERSVLEALQPHPNLKKIELWYYGGTSIPTTSCWFSSLRNLVSIKLYNCMKLCSLPSLDPFVSLEELELRDLESLEYVQNEAVAPSPSSPSNNHLHFLPSLDSLVITSCPNLIGWSPATTEESHLLPCVSTLQICWCPKMVSVPRFQVNFDSVDLMDVSSELLSRFGASLISPPTDPEFYQLRLCSVIHLPRGLMLQLASLESLCIRYCNSLTSLSPSILRHLPSLQELRIENCEVLELEDHHYGGDGDDDDDDDDDDSRVVLPSLCYLAVEKVPKLVALPRWLQHCSNLLELRVDKCDNLECLPSWLTKLTALVSLNVRECALLSARCRSNTAVDWPNISHITNIRIDGRDVQKDGRYLGIEEQRRQQWQQWQQLQQWEQWQQCQQWQQWQQQQVASPHTQISSHLGLEERQRQQWQQWRQWQQLKQWRQWQQWQQREQQQQEASSHTQISRLLGNCFARMTCNLFQRCFLP